MTVIISESTDSGVVIYADGKPVRVEVKIPQIARLLQEAASCQVNLTIDGEYAPQRDHLLCAKIAYDAAKTWFALQQKEAAKMIGS